MNVLKKLGKSTEVAPLYATRRGKEAIVGTISLYFHLRSTTSSIKPSSTTIQIESNAALYSTSFSLVMSNNNCSFIVTKRYTIAMQTPVPSGLINIKT